MAKVITFSTKFPTTHKRAGQPTFFVESFMAACADCIPGIQMIKDFVDWDWYAYYNCRLPKSHTIRSGKRWKVGDVFSPRIWTGKPYNSKQKQFMPDITIRKIWGVEIDEDCVVTIWNNDDIITFHLDSTQGQLLAANDGLTFTDFVDWFIPKPDKFKGFKGQIICWNEKINY